MTSYQHNGSAATPLRPPNRLRRTIQTSPLPTFALALLLAIALLALAPNIAHMASRTAWDDRPAGEPSAEDGTVLACIRHPGWTLYHHARPDWAPSFASSAEASFTLPVDAHALYLVSRGSYQTGTVHLKQGTEHGSDVRVDVRVAYNADRALARATLCRLRKDGRKHGIGIYTPPPQWPDGRDRLYVEVVFTFPAALSEGTPRHIQEFTTHASNFAHEIDDLWHSLLFGNMDLDTSNAVIHAKSVTLTRGTLKSSNGAIVGHFNTSDALVLRTSNARIDVTAALYYARGHEATQLDMWTSNGRITATVSLAAASDTAGDFSVTARSSNGAVKLHYDDDGAPPGARLVSDVRTSNACAKAAMHAAYEGAFEVGTSNARAVVRDTHPEDPLHRGRRHVVQMERSMGSVVSGRVYWAGGGGGGGDDDDGGRRRRGHSDGRSTVYTSNAGASLDL